MLVGYMRVSSDSNRQTTDLQRDALLSAGVDSRHLTNLAAGDTSVGSTPRTLFGPIEIVGITELSPVWRPLLHAIAGRVPVRWIAGPRSAPDWLDGDLIEIVRTPSQTPAVSAVGMRSHGRPPTTSGRIGAAGATCVIAWRRSGTDPRGPRTEAPSCAGVRIGCNARAAASAPLDNGSMTRSESISGLRRRHPISSNETSYWP